MAKGKSRLPVSTGVLVLSREKPPRCSVTLRVQGSGFRVQGAGCRVEGVGFRVQGSGFRVQGSGFRIGGFMVEA